MKLFEVAFIQKPSKKEADDGADPKLIGTIRPIMARDEQSAGINAILEYGIPEGVDKTRLEVCVRPF